VQVDPRVSCGGVVRDGAELLQNASVRGGLTYHLFILVTFLLAIDAIDNIGTKLELLAYCVQNNIKAFSSMGAGTKSDPTRIQTADLSAAHHDPVARAVRKRLRAVLSRSERPSPPTLPSYPPSTDADDDPIYNLPLTCLLRARILNLGGILIRGTQQRRDVAPAGQL
jgi:hypothetical protein